jgi:Rieske Fe-S protein
MTTESPGATGTAIPIRRRSFLNWFLGTTLGALMASIVYPIARFLSPPDVPEASTNEVEAGATNDPELLKKGFKIVHFGADPVILLRLSELEFRAFNATCTHLDCIVDYDKSRSRVRCNCHNGEYDLNGRNVAGPPPKPLTAFKVHVVARGANEPGTVVISRG